MEQDPFKKTEKTEEERLREEFAALRTDTERLREELRHTLEDLKKNGGEDEGAAPREKKKSSPKPQEETRVPPTSFPHRRSFLERNMRKIVLGTMLAGAGGYTAYEGGKEIKKASWFDINNPVASKIAKDIGLSDKNRFLSEVLNDKNIGLKKIREGIIAKEGGSPRGVKNNRGNIKYYGLPGQIDSGVKAKDGGTFASYRTEAEGDQAIDDIILSAASGNSPVYGKNPTFKSFIEKYTNSKWDPNAIPFFAQKRPQEKPSPTQELAEEKEEKSSQLESAQAPTREEINTSKQETQPTPLTTQEILAKMTVSEKKDMIKRWGFTEVTENGENIWVRKFRSGTMEKIFPVGYQRTITPIEGEAKPVIYGSWLSEGDAKLFGIELPSREERLRIEIRKKMEEVDEARKS